MEYVKMADDLEFSRVVLGFWRLLDWNLTTDELIKYLEECLDIGITTMDHADIYGNYTVEEKFGEAIKKRPDLRNKMQIITKCGIIYKSETARVKYYDYSKEHIKGQVEKSLKYMGVDHIDTLLLHRPSPFMDPAEISRAFEELKQEGKVRTFGVSNFLPDEFRLLKSYLTVPLITNQVELSPLRMGNMENGVINQCMEERIHPMAERPVKALKYRLTPEQWFMVWTAVKGHKVP